MDGNILLASFLFGMVGMGMFMFGKKSGHLVALGAGVGLMVVPYFIPNLTALLSVCTALTALPFFIRAE